MPTSQYYDRVYLQKVGHTTDMKQRAIIQGTKEFDRYLKQTPTRQIIILNGKQLDVVIHNSHQDREGSRYEKNILAPLEHNLKVGDMFEWEDHYWLILTQEILSVPTHFKGKIRLCNRTLRWCDAGIIRESPAHIVTRGIASLDSFQRSGYLVDTGTTIILAIVSRNEYTEAIKRYDRFILKQGAWQVNGIDNVSFDNLLFITLEEDQVNLARDDMENEIADRYIKEDESYHAFDKVFSIKGPDTLIWNQSGTYVGYEDGEIPSIPHSMERTNPELTIIENTGLNAITLKANSSGLVGETEITWYHPDVPPVKKKVKIVSLWGETK